MAFRMAVLEVANGETHPNQAINHLSYLQVSMSETVVFYKGIEKIITKPTSFTAPVFLSYDTV